MANGDAVEEIKLRLNIVDVISPKVSLKKAGRSFKGLCPFHSEKTPSFIVFPDKGNYHCFGCGANGDIFTFTMKTQNLDFAEALRLLAERAGVELAPRHAETESDRQLARLREVNEAASQFFHHVLLNSDEGEIGRAYVAKRGLSAQTIEKFQLGYAPDSWDSLSRYLQEKGYAAAELAAAGLVVERERGGYYDRFRRRVVFPIRDERGRVCGFGGRALDDSLPKYLNSPQTPLFDKGSSLYGIDLARQTIRQRDQAVIVEGYFDVLGCHEGGASNVVASLGTALTERQLGSLKNLTKNLVLALDPDAAGDEATLRGLEVAQQVYGGTAVPLPTPQGLVRFESRLDADIRIVRLPRGKDPDEIIGEDPSNWAALVTSALPLVDYYFEVAQASEDVKSAKGKSAVVARLLPLIHELRDGVLQTHYLQRLARLTQTSERTLERELRRVAGRSAASEDSPAAASQSRLTLEEYCLSLLLGFPSLIPNIGELMQSDVSGSPMREIYNALAAHAGQPASFSLDAFRQGLHPTLATLVDEVLRKASSLPQLSAPQAEKEVQSCLMEIRRHQLRARIRDLGHVTQDHEEAGDLEGARPFIASTDELLRELEPHEHTSNKAQVWR